MRILAVQTYPGANAGVARHYPFYLNAGADRVIGIVTDDDRCVWPGGKEHTVMVGPDSYVSGAHLPTRLLESIEACLALGADEIIVSEWDAIFFHPIPAPLPKGLSMVVTGLGSPGFQGKRYFHPPWAMDAETARQVVQTGYINIAEGMIEKGFPDRFIGLVAESAEIPVHTGHFRCYSQNALDRPQYLDEARRARLTGAHVIHGFKTREQLDYVCAP